MRAAGLLVAAAILTAITRTWLRPSDIEITPDLKER